MHTDIEARDTVLQPFDLFQLFGWLNLLPWLFCNASAADFPGKRLKSFSRNLPVVKGAVPQNENFIFCFATWQLANFPTKPTSLAWRRHNCFKREFTQNGMLRTYTIRISIPNTIECEVFLYRGAAPLSLFNNNENTAHHSVTVEEPSSLSPPNTSHTSTRWPLDHRHFFLFQTQLLSSGSSSGIIHYFFKC